MTDSTGFSRRRFLQLTGVGLAGAAGLTRADTPQAEAVTELSPPPGFARLLRRAEVPEAQGARVVVLGGGWSGLTMAKYLKRFNPAFDVVLLDKQEAFLSFPLSNSWLADQVGLDFLSHSFFDAANNHGYHFVQAEMLDLDREARKVYTDVGYLEYDYLVLAPGIDYDYERIGVSDPHQQSLLFHRFPGGFKTSSELLTIKRKVHRFRHGVFALNVPNGDNRCTAAPYERACMVAALFRKRRLRAKVLLLDMNTGIKIEKDGFSRAFKQLYGDYIEYIPSAEISSVDIEGKTLSTEFDDFPFDDAVVYPPVRASRLLENAGIANMDSPQKAANTDPFRYNVIGDDRVYVTGDSRGQPFSKGGHTAHSEAQYVAEVIAGHALGREVPWRSPQTMCFSSVAIDPLQAMSIITYYKFNEKTKEFNFDRTHAMENWDIEGGQASLAWAEGMFKDMFYG